MDGKIRIQYKGVCALLGRLSNRNMSEDDLYCIECALNDCAKAFSDRFEVVKTSRGGFSLEPIMDTNVKKQHE